MKFFERNSLFEGSLCVIVARSTANMGRGGFGGNLVRASGGRPISSCVPPALNPFYFPNELLYFSILSRFCENVALAVHADSK